MDIEIHIRNDQEDSEPPLARFEALIKHICARFGLKSGQISISIVDDKQISGVNERFLGHSGPTDVISFDLSDEDGQGVFDIIVNAQMARRQAGRRNHSVEAELALYITHGMLHNLGFDDAEPGQAARMHAEEDKILLEAGFGRVYGQQRTEDDI